MRVKRQYINSLSKEEQLALLKKDGLLLRLIDDQTTELCKAAVKQTGKALRWVKIPTLKVLLQVIISWQSLSPVYIKTYKTPEAESTPEFLDSALLDGQSPIKGWIDDDSPGKSISVYSGLSGKKLKSLHDKLYKKYAKIFNDRSIGIQNRLKQIEAAIAADMKNKVSLKDFVREWFYRQLRALSMVAFLAVKKRNDFGDMGQDNVYIGLLRNILDIDPASFVFPYHAIYFDIILLHYDKANGFRSGDEYMALSKELSVQLFGQTLYEDEIKSVVSFTGDWIRNVTGHRCGIKFLYGTMREERVNGTTLRTYLQEYARSLHTLSNVAWADKDYISIRKESLAVIYDNKWAAFFETEIPLREYKWSEKNQAISQEIKRQALHLYGAYNTDEVAQRAQLITEEIEAGVFAHERAHQEIDAVMDPIQEHIRDVLCSDDGYNVVYAIREAQADWGMGQTGAVPWFLAIAREKGPEAGTRVLWVYLSDNFFINSDEKHFPLMTKLLIGLVLPFINPDKTIDFYELEKRQEYIRVELWNRMEKLILRVLNLIETYEYQILNYKFDYQRLEDECFEIFKDGKTDYTREKLRNDWDYWRAVIDTLKLKGKERLDIILAQEAASLEAFVLENANARPGITLIEYIIENFIEFLFLDRKKVYLPSKLNHGFVSVEL